MSKLSNRWWNCYLYRIRLTIKQNLSLIWSNFADIYVMNFEKNLWNIYNLWYFIFQGRHHEVHKLDPSPDWITSSERVWPFILHHPDLHPPLHLFISHVLQPSPPCPDHCGNALRSTIPLVPDFRVRHTRDKSPLPSHGAILLPRKLCRHRHLVWIVV